MAMVAAMNYSNDIKFDVIKYIRKLRNIGISQEMAEIQGEELSHTIQTIASEVKSKIKRELHIDDLSTKGGLREAELRLQNEILITKGQIRESELRLLKEIETVRKEIANVKNELIKWVLAAGITASVAICSAMYTMFKAFIH